MSAPTPHTTVDLSKYIEIRGGRANIRGRRLPVSFIVAAERSPNASIADIAHDFTISEEQVLAALLYYREHKDEIDAQDIEDQAAFDEMYRQYGSNKPGQA